MADERYNLIFRGELAKSATLDQAKQNLMRLFKIDRVKVDAMFSGKAVVLKKNLTLEAANKYRVAIKKAGALIELEDLKVKANAKTSTEKVVSKDVADTGLNQTQTAQESKKEKAGALAVEPVGQLLKEGEKHHFVEKEIDLSAYSVRSEGGNLLDADEYKNAVPVSVNTASLDLAPAGADVLKPEERKAVKPVKVDTSALEIGQPGERLGPKAPPAPPAPDVSQLFLVPD